MARRERPIPTYGGWNKATGGSNWYSDIDMPPNMILCYNPSLIDELVKQEQIQPAKGSKSIFIVKGTGGSVGLVRPGMGAPAAALMFENLFARGARNFIVMGTVGSLQKNVPPGTVVLCNKAYGETGVARDYQPGRKELRASSQLTRLIGAGLDNARLRHFTGSVVTTDSMYERETPSFVNRFRRKGVLGIDMEAAGLFAMAKRRGAKMGAVFSVSDSEVADSWVINLGNARENYRGIFDAAVNALSSINAKRAPMPRRLDNRPGWWKPGRGIPKNLWVALPNKSGLGTGLKRINMRNARLIPGIPQGRVRKRR